jgi:hypothetical protein
MPAAYHPCIWKELIILSPNVGGYREIMKFE